MRNNPNTYLFSESFAATLVELTEGFLSPEEIDLLIETFQAETEKVYFTQSSENNLIRILNSLYDRVSFLQDCIKYPHHVEILTSICANSNYLTDIVVRNPEFLYEIFDPQFLSIPLSENKLQIQISNGLKNFRTTKAKINFLKNTKKRILLKTAVSDLLHMNGLNTVINDLSVLAKTIISNLFQLCYNEVLKKYGIENIKRKFCLITLGKMGGGELNYSSDIDLILIFDKNTVIKKINRAYFEILDEATQLFINTASEFTDRGFLYRIDFRLRPDGKFSPLSRSLKDTILYYESKGEHWERQMLIKANYLTGDESLFNKFKNFLNLFIYSSVDFSVLTEIKQMKRKIESKIDESDVKLFSGGIRDIEFCVQALQLLNGKKINGLKTGNTLEAINILEKNNLLSRKESTVLRESYIFYRKIEHYLQLMEDKQTHSIPTNNEIQLKLAFYLDFNDITKFNAKLNETRNKVRQIFNSILNDSQLSGFNGLSLDSIQFKNKTECEKYLKFLRSGIGPVNQKRFESRTIKLFSEIEPALYDYLTKSKNPDKVINNFARIIERTKFPSLFYSEFRNKSFFNTFLTICEYSQRAIDLWIADKSLDEIFLSRRIFIEKLESHFTDFSLKQIQYILSVQFALKLINRDRLSLILSEFIDFRIKNLLKKDNLPFRYFICGLGSYGTKDLNFESDIDLIFVTSHYDKNYVTMFFVDVLEKLKSEIAPFTVDVRLRPEGAGSPLVWELDGYINYYKKRARIWELQTATKMRLITGEKVLYKKLLKVINERITKQNEKEIASGILSMYKNVIKENRSQLKNFLNIKKGRGTLVTIDFLIQFLILKKKYFLQIIDKRFTEKIDYLSGGNKKLLSLKENYLFLKNIEVSIQNIFNQKAVTVQKGNEKTEILSAFLNFENSASFISKINSVIEKNNLIFNKYLHS